METVAQLRAFILAERKAMPKITAKKAVLLEAALKYGYVRPEVPPVKTEEPVPLFVKRSKSLDTRIEPANQKYVIQKKTRAQTVPAVPTVPAVVVEPVAVLKPNVFSKMNELRRANPTMSKSEIGALYSKGRLANVVR